MLFFFNDTATTEIYTLSLHDALPIWALRAFAQLRRRGLPHRLVIAGGRGWLDGPIFAEYERLGLGDSVILDRKSTRLNSSHANISYAVFCLKKKKNQSKPRLFSALYS